MTGAGAVAGTAAAAKAVGSVEAMPGFLDVHSHMVPSGDDGVRTEADGLELCAEAARRGTTVLYATPHVWPHFTLDEEREREVRAAHALMAPKAAGFGLDLRLGWELTPAPALLDEDLRRYRFQGLPAVLMELPFAGPLGLAERLATEIEAAGLVPIIGHPERADGIIADPDGARAYVERGWLLQVNGTSLTGAHGRNPHETGWFLVEEGLAGLMGSDGHRPRRPPFLDEAYKLARERIGEEADDLFAGAALARAVEQAA